MEARPFRINGFLARQLSQKWSKVKRFKGALQCTWLSPVSADSGKVPTGSPTSVVITVFNPTGNVQNFTVSKSKFTPSTFGDTVDSIYGAGTISSGDSRISVVPSFSVPAGGSYDLKVTINPGHSTGVVQGWISLNGPGSNDLHFAYYA